MTRSGAYRRFIHFDFVYSSACPCSAELSEHARDRRGVYAIPHSQRSKARVTLEEAEGKKIWIEDVHAHCLDALQTETQVMVKREDEQAFAELNGAMRVRCASCERSLRVLSCLVCHTLKLKNNRHNILSVFCG